MLTEKAGSIIRLRKVWLPLLVAGLVLAAGCIPAAYEGGGEQDEYISDFQYLQGYGEWFDVSPYGSVWRPFTVSGWEPFYYGHWIWTDDGWAWVSYEPFGWLVYHYGGWDYRNDYGWFWIPGEAWSPAPVQWYSSGDYCAWAPLPPPDTTWPAPWEAADRDIWIIVPIDRFTDENVGRRKLTTPQPRRLLSRESSLARPPDITVIRNRENRSLDPVVIRKESVELRAGSVTGARPAAAPADTTLERMILPRSDRRKVEKHSPEVKRKVLTTRENTAPPLPPPETPPPDGKKSGEDGTKQLKRR